MDWNYGIHWLAESQMGLALDLLPTLLATPHRSSNTNLLLTSRPRSLLFLLLLLFERLNFFKGYSTFAVDPFSVNEVLVVHIYDLDHTLNILIGNEPKPTGLLSSFVSHYDAVIHGSVPSKVMPKVLLLQVVGKTSDKYLFVLRIYSIRFSLFLEMRRHHRLLTVTTSVLLFGRLSRTLAHLIHRLRFEANWTSKLIVVATLGLVVDLWRLHLARIMHACILNLCVPGFTWAINLLFLRRLLLQDSIIKLIIKINLILKIATDNSSLLLPPTPTTPLFPTPYLFIPALAALPRPARSHLHSLDMVLKRAPLNR